MKTVPDIIDAFGGPTRFAAVIKRGPSTASEMKRSRSIPVTYWPDVIREAAKRDLPITADVLVMAHTGATSTDFLPRDGEAA